MVSAGGYCPAYNYPASHEINLPVSIPGNGRKYDNFARACRYEWKIAAVESLLLSIIIFYEPALLFYRNLFFRTYFFNKRYQ